MSVKRGFTFDSGDGRIKIHAAEWRQDKGEICGVLQFWQGSGDFIARLEDLAEDVTRGGVGVVRK